MRTQSVSNNDTVTNDHQLLDVIKVLHVDDDSDHLIITKRWIEKFEPRIKVCVTSDTEAVFKTYSMYDCILSDFKMPKMNGIQIATKIRKESGVPIILFTAQGSEEVASEAFGIGINDYIMKDIDPSHYQVLSNRIISVVERKRAEEQSERYRIKIETLHNSTAELSKANDIQSITSIALNAIESVLGFKWAGFGIVEADAIRYIDYLGFSIPENWRLPLNGPGITVRCVNSKETQLVPDIRIDPDYVKGKVDDEITPEIKSELVVPVKIDDNVVAVLNIESESVNAFSKEDQVLIELLAIYISSALDRINRFEEIKKMNEYYRIFIESSPEAVCVISNEKYVYGNTQFASLLGYDHFTELQGRSVSETIAPEHKDIVMSRVKGRSRGENHPKRYEFKLLKKDGSFVDVETVVSVIEYEGKPASLAFTRDVTQNIQYEEKFDTIHRSARVLN